MGRVVDAGHAEADEEVDRDEQADLRGQIARVARQGRLVHAIGHEQDPEQPEDPTAGTDGWVGRGGEAGC